MSVVSPQRLGEERHTQVTGYPGIDAACITILHLDLLSHENGGRNGF